MGRRRTNSPINVLLVDDHAIARESQRRMLARDNQLRLLGAATAAEQPAGPSGGPDPDVIVVDVSLPGISGIETLRRVVDTRPTAARVLMFSPYKDALYVARALDAGAHGYLTKSSPPDMLLTAIRAVAGGRRFVSPDVQRNLTKASPDARSIARELSQREHEILRLLSEGHDLSEIARRLGISVKTVANRQTAIKQKLGAGSAMQLLVIARRLGLSPRAEASASEQNDL